MQHAASMARQMAHKRKLRHSASQQQQPHGERHQAGKAVLAKLETFLLRQHDSALVT
jgi:hypothetical protein